MSLNRNSHVSPRGPRTGAADRRARGPLRGAGVVRSGVVFGVGVLLGLSAAMGPAFADETAKAGDGGAWSSDPTVGTLPMQGDAGAPDQAITLRGTTESIRRALRSLAPLADGDVTAWADPVVFPDGTAWLRLHGDVELTLDATALDGVEVGVFSGFEGGGMAYVAQTAMGFARGADMHAGEEFEIDTYRLLSAGVLTDSVRIHCVHSTGLRGTVGLIRAPSDGALILRQDV